MSETDRPRNQPDDAPAPPSAALWEAVLEKIRDAAAPRFEVERLLGYGGMAGVYLAREPKLGRHVAIKVMAPSLMMDPDLVERFRQEARTIARLNHPNIITVYDVTEEENLHYFVMAYVPGRTIGHVMKEIGGPLPLDVVRAWIYQIGSALDYAHGFDVVHRDVKPGNILLDARGNALVTDFGIAKVADQEGLTRTGMLVGTPAYMSPEQCSSGTVGAASDQYSLGALSYQMLTGAPPFSGPTMAVLHAHVRQPPEPVRSIRPDCPPEVADVVDRMLAKAPWDRWPSIGRALSAMGAIPVGHDAPVRSRLVDLAAPVEKVTASSPRGVQRPPVPSDPVAPGETFVVDATVTGPGERVLTGRRVTWTSENPGVARILPDGRIIAIAPGTARITARCGGIRDSLVFPVEGEAGGVEVAAAPREIPQGTRVQLAEVLPPGAPLAVGPDSGWGSTHPGVARVTADGQLEALRPGTATVTAFHQGRAVMADVTVTPAGTDEGAAGMWASTPVPAGGGAASTPTPSGAVPPTGPTPAATPTPTHGTPAGTPAPGTPAPGTPRPGTARAGSAAGAGSDAAGQASTTGQAPPAGSSTGEASATGSASAGPGAASSTGGFRRPLALAGVGVVAMVVVLGGGLMLFQGGGFGLFGGDGGGTPEGPPAATGSEVLGPGDVPTAAEADEDQASAGDPGGRGDPADPGADAGAAAGTDAGTEQTAQDLAEADQAAGADPEQEGGQPPSPELPEEGAVRAAGLPPGARAAVIVEGRELLLTPGEARPLPPGSYEVRVAASGYEAYQGQITVSPGETLDWQPALQAEPEADTEGYPAAGGAEPEEEQPEPAGPDPEVLRAEVMEEVRVLVDAFAAAFESREMDQVLAFFLQQPGAWAAQWQPLVEDTRNARDLQADITDLENLELQGADQASVTFSVQLQYRDFRNSVQNAVLEFQALVERQESGWRFRQLTEGS